MLLLITISTFVCISLGMMGVYWLLYRPQSAATERLKRLGERTGSATSIPISLDDNRPGSELAERIASPLSRLVPPSAAEAKKLQKQLMQAGLRSPNAPAMYRAIQLVTMAALPAIVALGVRLNVATDKERGSLRSVCFPHWLRPSSICTAQNDPLAATTRALGARGCAGPDGHFDRGRARLECGDDEGQQ